MFLFALAACSAHLRDSLSDGFYSVLARVPCNQLLVREVMLFQRAKVLGAVQDVIGKSRKATSRRDEVVLLFRTGG